MQRLARCATRNKEEEIKSLWCILFGIWLTWNSRHQFERPQDSHCPECS